VSEADADLRERVRLYLIHSGHLPIRLLDVEAQSGIVTLRGTVPTFYFRQLAVECAKRVAGTLGVVDHILIVC
jgi:osmotically-inducible protein OsmY